MLKIELIKEQYPSLRKWQDLYALEIYKKIEEEQVINEYLKTVEPVKTTKQLEKQVGGHISVTYSSSNIVLTFDLITKELLDKVNKFMDSYGWYASFIGTDQMRKGGKYSKEVKGFLGDKDVSIFYEAKYDEEDVQTTKYLYHITPDLKWQRIKALGLTPKVQGKISDHPGRIYLLKDSVDFRDNIIDIAFSLYNHYPHKEKVKEMYLLKIDTAKIKNMMFFKDPNFYMGDAVWTYQNIPPNAITVEDKINMTH